MTPIFLGSHAAIQEVACWAHARRKFFDAVKSYPRESHQVLEWIRQLYDIEDRARTRSPEARRELRVAESIPVLDKIEAYLTGLARTVLPKSSLAKAVNYARNQWAALRRYTEDGRLTIDNNVSEADPSAPKLLAGRTGSSWEVKPRVRGRRCYARSWPARSVIGIEPGVTYATFFSACMRRSATG